MVKIKLKDGQSAYDVIGDYIRRYWKHNGYTDVIVSIGTSHNGRNYSLFNEVACLEDFDDILYLGDWWEGEEYIQLLGIQSVDELDICGGIYD